MVGNLIKEVLMDTSNLSKESKALLETLPDDVKERLEAFCEFKKEHGIQKMENESQFSNHTQFSCYLPNKGKEEQTEKEEDMNQPSDFILNRIEAFKYFSEGMDPQWSTDIAGFTTAGYGHHKEFGDWELPLAVHEDSLTISYLRRGDCIVTNNLEEYQEAVAILLDVGASNIHEHPKGTVPCDYLYWGESNAIISVNRMLGTRKLTLQQAKSYVELTKLMQAKLNTLQLQE